MQSYRKIWEQYHGKKVPRGHHIHHIDGNRENNTPENLLCCSAEEHWMIHYTQGDIIARNGKFVQGASEAGRRGGRNGRGVSGNRGGPRLHPIDARTRLFGKKRTHKQKESSRLHSERLKGRPAWNKGLRKETDARVAANALACRKPKRR